MIPECMTQNMAQPQRKPSAGEMGIKAVAIGSILVLSAVNYFGVKPGTSLQTFITLGKVLAILLIITLGFAFGSRLDDHFVTGNIPSSEMSLSNFLLAMVAGLFTFGGWHMVTYNSEETIEPRKTIPRALIFGTLIVKFCYMGISLWWQQNTGAASSNSVR